MVLERVSTFVSDAQPRSIDRGIFPHDWGLVISCTVAFDLPPSEGACVYLFPALLYLPVPLLLAATVRFGGKGASGAILHHHRNGAGPRNPWRRSRLPVGPPGHSALSVQLFLAVLAVALRSWLAALVEELQRTNERLSTMLDGISDGYCTIDGERTDHGAFKCEGRRLVWPQRASGDLIGRDYWRVYRRTNCLIRLGYSARCGYLEAPLEARLPASRWPIGASFMRTHRSGGFENLLSRH